MGIILGFGMQNALIWSRWVRLSNFFGIMNLKLSPEDISPLMITIQYPTVRVPNAIKVPELNPEFPSLYAEWGVLEKTKRDIPMMEPPSYVDLPDFIYWQGYEESVNKFIKARSTLGMILNELHP